MAKTKLTPTDVISVLQHSNVPTIISEGKGDAIVLRRIEDIFAEIGITVLAAGGRETVLSVFDRRHELPKNNVFLFFVDQDCWIYSGMPIEFLDDNLFHTDGYSIENDMFRDGELTSFLTASEDYAFKADLSRFLDWYSVAIERHLADKSAPISTSTQVILDDVDDIESYLELTCDESYPGVLRDHLHDNYSRALRGKSLFSLLNRQLSQTSRTVKLSGFDLLEIGSARSGVFLNRVADWVRGRLTHYGFPV